MQILQHLHHRQHGQRQQAQLRLNIWWLAQVVEEERLSVVAVVAVTLK
jgi:hypothetical protein